MDGATGPDRDWEGCGGYCTTRARRMETGRVPCISHASWRATDDGQAFVVYIYVYILYSGSAFLHPARIVPIRFHIHPCYMLYVQFVWRSKPYATKPDLLLNYCPIWRLSSHEMTHQVRSNRAHVYSNAMRTESCGSHFRLSSRGHDPTVRYTVATAIEPRSARDIALVRSFGGPAGGSGNP